MLHELAHAIVLIDENLLGYLPASSQIGNLLSAKSHLERDLSECWVLAVQFRMIQMIGLRRLIDRKTLVEYAQGNDMLMLAREVDEALGRYLEQPDTDVLAEEGLRVLFDEEGLKVLLDS